MPDDQGIKFINEHAEEHLEKFTREARASKSENAWRCLYAALDQEIIKDPAKKNIATTFLESTFDRVFEVQAFWLASGHLFVFFQGPVRAVIKEYERFLNALSEDGKKIEYHFFWELSKFWGYFDQVLAGAIEPAPFIEMVDVRTKKEITEENHPLIISKDLYRQRHVRYKPLLLIVEDDRVTRHFLQAIMEKYCDIAVAWNAEQARACYETMLPNITFLDIELSDGDGQALAEIFCAHDPESFVVMVSGTLSPDKIERCLRAGVKGAVKKPAQEGKLLRFVDQYNKERQKKSASD